MKRTSNAYSIQWRQSSASMLILHCYVQLAMVVYREKREEEEEKEITFFVHDLQTKEIVWKGNVHHARADPDQIVEKKMRIRDSNDWLRVRLRTAGQGWRVFLYFVYQGSFGTTEMMCVIVRNCWSVLWLLLLQPLLCWSSFRTSLPTGNK